MATPTNQKAINMITESEQTMVNALVNDPRYAAFRSLRDFDIPDKFILEYIKNNYGLSSPFRITENNKHIHFKVIFRMKEQGSEYIDRIHLDTYEAEDGDREAEIQILYHEPKNSVHTPKELGFEDIDDCYNKLHHLKVFIELVEPES